MQFSSFLCLRQQDCGLRFGINPLNAELNPICHFVALLGIHHFLHVSRIRVKSLTVRLLMSYIYIYIYIYIYGAPILDVSRSHTMRSWVRIPPGAWIFVCCECRVLSGRGLCDELITRPEESYRLWCVVVCVSRNIKNGCSIYIYDISSLRVNDLTLILLTWRNWWAPNNASKLADGI